MEPKQACDELSYNLIAQYGKLGGWAFYHSYREKILDIMRELHHEQTT